LRAIRRRSTLRRYKADLIPIKSRHLTCRDFLAETFATSGSGQLEMVFAVFEIEGWRPGIGDPTIWGWITVANYALAFGLSVKAARIDGKNSNFWVFLAIAMLALGLNKQLDLQSLLTVILKNNALRHGWYDQRRELQKMFILIAFIVSAVSMVFVAFYFRKAGRYVIFALVGLSLVSTFIAARAASFHHMDELLNLRILALRLNHILENTGIAIIAASAAAVRRNRPAAPRPKRSH